MTNIPQYFIVKPVSHQKRNPGLQPHKPTGYTLPLQASRHTRFGQEDEGIRAGIKQLEAQLRDIQVQLAKARLAALAEQQLHQGMEALHQGNTKDGIPLLKAGLGYLNPRLSDEMDFSLLFTLEGANVKLIEWLEEHEPQTVAPYQAVLEQIRQRIDRLLGGPDDFFGG